MILNLSAKAKHHSLKQLDLGFVNEELDETEIINSKTGTSISSSKEWYCQFNQQLRVRD